MDASLGNLSAISPATGWGACHDLLERLPKPSPHLLLKIDFVRRSCRFRPSSAFLPALPLHLLFTHMHLLLLNFHNRVDYLAVSTEYFSISPRAL
jgi:hypothetical protein